MINWTTDEYGNRIGTYQGWVITFRAGSPSPGPEVFRAEDRVNHIPYTEIDIIDGEIYIRHDAPYDGMVTVTVPICVMQAILAAPP